METNHILDIKISILKDGQTPNLPKHIVNYLIISEEKYMQEYLRPYVNVNFSNKEKLLIMYIDPNRHDIKTGQIYDIIKRVSGITKEQIRGTSRKGNILFMRQIFHFTFMTAGMGPQENAGEETNNSHATVINSIKIINNCIDVDKGPRKELFLKLIKEFKAENILK